MIVGIMLRYNVGIILRSFDLQLVIVSSLKLYADQDSSNIDGSPLSVQPFDRLTGVGR